MRNINFDELKAIELEILKKIHNICENENLRYSLIGGTLLGAVRHKGFIPWDDDIDIVMPRKDYETFIDYCVHNSTELPFYIVSSKTNKNYGYLFAKACAKGTTIEEVHGNRYQCNLGVYVDIFPVDGLGVSFEEAKKTYAKTTFKRELLVASNWKEFFRSKTRAIYFEPIRYAFYLMSRLVNVNKLINKIDEICKKKDFDSSKYVGVVCGVYRRKEIMKKDVFAEYEKIEFEGLKVNALKNSKEYLSNIYGDYMKLPPKEKQFSHHMFKAYYMD